MVNAITDTSWIAAVFGPGVVRRSNALQPVGGVSPSGGEPAPGSALTPSPVDTVEISAAAMHRFGRANAVPAEPQAPDGTDRSVAPGAATPGDAELTAEEQQELQKLKRTDREVRRHEQAHIAAGGGHMQGAPSYQYKTGSDGRQYAVSGEVNVDTSEVAGDPQATIAKMQQIRRAALAPANPSSQDRRIAADAAAKEQQARAELAEESRAESGGTSTNELSPTIDDELVLTSGPRALGADLDIVG